jgi:deoxyadenosine/deoxycytidine kinase
VEGIIGAGKTTLTHTLAERLRLRPLLEPVETNPYLERFYKDPKRWAFALQVELLHRRYAMQKLAAYEATSEGGYAGAVLDRGLPGDRVFCRQHVLAGNIDELEWQTYERAYDNMVCSLMPPSLLVFLDVTPEVALERIKQRRRVCEGSISLDYLRGLQRGYYDLLVEIEAGDHAWSRGIQVARIPWNVEHQPVNAIVSLIIQKMKP